MMGANDWPTVYAFVALLAERLSVVGLIAQFGVILPGLFVVGLYAVATAAILALVIVTLEYLFTPAAIAPRVALLVRIVLARSGIAARLAAILIWVSALLFEVTAAIGADKNGSDAWPWRTTIGAIQLPRLGDPKGLAA